jgi:phage FluMu protein Com
MILRKNEAKCERCKGIISNMPIQLSDYCIKIIENPMMLGKDTICYSNTNWKCPVCGHINFEKIEIYLNEDDYVVLIASRYNKDFSIQEVRFD